MSVDPVRLRLELLRRGVPEEVANAIASQLPASSSSNLSPEELQLVGRMIVELREMLWEEEPGDS